MGSQPLIVNELLAFIQNAIHNLDDTSVVQICKSSFDEEEVCRSKTLLFESLGKSDEMPPRRRDGGAKSIQDIVTMFRKIDLDPNYDGPVFVAKDLSKLPSVTFDHVDVTRVLKDITFLKANLVKLQTKLELSSNTISMRCEAQNASSAPQNASSAAVAAAAVLRPASPTSAPLEVTPRASTSTPRRAYADAIVKRPAVQHQRPPEEGKPSRCDSVRPDLQRPKPKEDEDGFIKVERRKKTSSRNKCGTAPTGPRHLLRPAKPTTQLYVSRLTYSTKPETIVEFVRVKTGLTLRVERLESRRKVDFKSFVVLVPTEDLSTFTAAEFWPKGVLFRRFRGRVPDTANGLTSQTT